MKIVAHDKFKSIQPFGIIELPDLTVITGLNGSGKTQLLGGIQTTVIFAQISDIKLQKDEISSIGYR